MSTTNTKEEVLKAYLWIRRNNNTIPDDILQLMKDAAIERLSQSSPVEEDKNEETLKRIIAVYPDHSIFIYHYNDLCLAICKNRLNKGDIVAYHPVEITGGQSSPVEESAEMELMIKFAKYAIDNVSRGGNATELTELLNKFKAKKQFKISKL